MNDETNAALHAIAEAIQANAAQSDAWHDPAQIAPLAAVLVAFASLLASLWFTRRQVSTEEGRLANENIRLKLDTEAEKERLARERAQLELEHERAERDREELRLKATEDRTRLALELRIRRLDEFYGRIQIQNRLSLSLYQKLMEHGSKPDGWSYLLHAAEVHADPVDRALMSEIIEVNRVINDLITTRGGFIRELDPLFTKFQRHFRLVDNTFKGVALPTLKFSDTFPRGFDDYIDNECKALRKEIDDIDSALLQAKDIARRTEASDEPNE